MVVGSSVAVHLQCNLSDTVTRGLVLDDVALGFKS